MVITASIRERILVYYEKGFRPPTIHQKLRDEGIFVSRVGIWKFLRVYRSTGSVARREGSGRPTKITREVKLLIEAQMLKDDETTAYQIHKLLTDKGINISVSTILRCRKELGWTFRGSAYCQLIRAVNKEKRLAWAKQYLDEAEDGFDNVIWTDESSIQAETHKRFCYRKKSCAPKTKPRYLQGVVTLIKCIEPFATGIKMKSTDQE